MLSIINIYIFVFNMVSHHAHFIVFDLRLEN